MSRSLIKRPRARVRLFTSMKSGVVPRIRELGMARCIAWARLRTSVIGTALAMVGRVPLRRSRSLWRSPYSITRLEACSCEPSSSSESPWVGLMLRMMTLDAPRRLIRSSASRLEPSPMANIEMTDPTPRITPSIVSRLRNLCRSRLLIPSLSV